MIPYKLILTGLILVLIVGSMLTITKTFGEGPTPLQFRTDTYIPPIIAPVIVGPNGTPCKKEG